MIDHSEEHLDLSIVLPCFEERDAVGSLIAELSRTLDELPLRSEIICVDDHSGDDTVEVLTALQREHARIVIARHSCRCGQSAALCTGFRIARGSTLVSMDADGQADPRDIPRLLASLSGVDLVCGVRARRQDDWVKRLSSRIGNGFRRLITRDPTTDAGCTYRAMAADVVSEIPVFNGVHRFLPALLRMRGLTVVEIPVAHRPRSGGVSKYGVGNRAWRGVLDCLAMLWWRRRSVPARRLLALNRSAAAAHESGAGAGTTADTAARLEESPR